ncbi:MAG TPA: RNA polymerase sigma factor [Polyangiaceae bacterium]|nr:RNA polymerase sigma factor [Polyangiaceae bacterium]
MLNVHPKPQGVLSLVPPPEGGGSPIDLDEAFRRYAPLVASISFRILGVQQDVEDTVQDVFLEARRWINRIHDPGALKSWLTTVTVRTARRRLRLRRLKTMLHLGDAPEYLEVADAGASPRQRALLAEIYRVLDRLPIEERFAWTLRLVEGQSLPEVAQHCGCSLATVKRRVANAQRAISEALADE